MTASSSAGTSPASVVVSTTTSGSSCTSGFCPVKTPVDYDATLLVRGQSVVIYYKGALASGSAVTIHSGFNNWAAGTIADAAMTKRSDGYWQSPAIALPSTATELDFVFNNGAGTWDNNSGADWKLAVARGRPARRWR